MADIEAYEEAPATDMLPVSTIGRRFRHGVLSLSLTFGVKTPIGVPRRPQSCWRSLPRLQESSGPCPLKKTRVRHNDGLTLAVYGTRSLDLHRSQPFLILVGADSCDHSLNEITLNQRDGTAYFAEICGHYLNLDLPSQKGHASAGKAVIFNPYGSYKDDGQPIPCQVMI
ncbi:hypothetical protein [Sphaerisporangium corydalis]|uniref:Uncharacterized protein n=1 Tax=Sphaerisporangium corydalis TaxID=1441875 RepID=A0ABV9EIG6_9ACTN|nr:hypothetical protein [Sphaerisporangium corydalis]